MGFVTSMSHLTFQFSHWSLCFSIIYLYNRLPYQTVNHQKEGDILFKFVFSTLSTVSSKYWSNSVEHWKPERCWDTINCRKGHQEAPLTYLMSLDVEKDSGKVKGQKVWYMCACVCEYPSAWVAFALNGGHRVVGIEGKAPGATKKPD